MLRLLAGVMLIPFTLGELYAMKGAKPRAHNPVEKRPIQMELNRLTRILQKLAPVTSVSSSLFGTAPDFVGVSYCWSFKEADPGLYRDVEEALKAFHGEMTWTFNFQFNQEGGCIAGLSGSEKFYSPIRDFGPLNTQAGRVSQSARVAVADEVRKLCTFMANAFRVIHPRRQLPIPDFVKPNGLATPTVFDVVLVRDVKKFRWPTPTSVVDRQLDFGITYDEWYALYFEVLGKSANLTSKLPVDFQGVIAGYPMLSRLNDIHDGAVIAASEVTSLEAECIQIQTAANDNSSARLCLEKLILICNWAKGVDVGIWFSGQ